jgi:hypothetical protein
MTGAQPGGQLPPAPALGHGGQPWLGDRGEVDGGDPVRLEAEIPQPPLAAGVFRFPAAAEGQQLDARAGIQDELPASGPDAAGLEPGPLLLRPLQER